MDNLWISVDNPHPPTHMVKQKEAKVNGKPPSYTRRIIRIGGSFYISIPRVYLARVGAYRGQTVRLELGDGKITINIVQNIGGKDK